LKYFSSAFYFIKSTCLCVYLCYPVKEAEQLNYIMRVWKYSFIQNSWKENKAYVLTSLVLGTIYFIILRIIYPVPSFYSDSFTWVGAAVTGQPVTFRPVGYSKIMRFLHLFTTSDFPLIAAQYFSNLFVNLFLFLTCNWFFKLYKPLKLLLFVLLIINPFYLFYSNYVSSDAFFCCLSVLWFTLLIWILYKPYWSLIIFQLVVLAGLFTLRYNAVFFPAIMALAILLTKLTWPKKAIAIGINVVTVAVIIMVTTYVTKKVTGTKTFSAFSGWQLANDALHVMQHEKIDTTTIKDKEVRSIVNFSDHFFDTTTEKFPDTTATAYFMWYFKSPLKRYMTVYPGRSKSYFRTWNTLGPVYAKFGKTIILQKPLTYLQYFALPNLKAYFLPPLEIYETYMENRDTMPSVITKFFHYKTIKTPQHFPALYTAVFQPVRILFIAFNIMFICVTLYYVISKRYLFQNRLFNQTLLSFSALYLANFFFIVLLAPSVIRYHIFLLTLGFPIILYLLQQLLKPLQTEEKKMGNIGLQTTLQ